MSLPWIPVILDIPWVLKILEPWRAARGKADVIRIPCCSSSPFSSITLVIITLTLQMLKKNIDIIKCDSDFNEGVCGTWKSVSYFYVTISRCDY